MRSKLYPLLLLCACNNEGLGGEDSQALFDESNKEIHALHQQYFAMDPLPEGTYSHVCADGGQILMEVVYEGADVAALLHSFEDCSLSGSTYSGTLDYSNIVGGLCGGSGFGFDIEGELSLSGDIQGDCRIDAYEECGLFSGTSCGHEVDKESAR